MSKPTRLLESLPPPIQPIDPATERALRSEILQVMSLIRERTPRDPVDPETAKGSEVWEGRIDGRRATRVIIYLRSSGCAWAIGESTDSGSIRFKAGCLDCEHSVRGTTFGRPITEAAYIRQFHAEFRQYDFTEHTGLCIYNEGNFFNPRELPTAARRAILEAVGKTPGIRAVILESLPEYLDAEVLTETRAALGDRRIEIGIGLESADPVIRALCVNKSYSLARFETAAGTVNRYADLLAYVLLKPSFLTEAEALADTIRATRFAFAAGAKVVSIEPVNASDYNMSGALRRIGLHREPWLWSVIEALRATHDLGEVRIGGFQFAPHYVHHARNCPACTPAANTAIRQYNMTYDLDVFSALACPCRDEWRAELSAAHPALTSRLRSTLDRLKADLKGP